ncbi:B-cell receptor-associated protein 31-like-domain-containing protein [Sphaerosporella brunnea]|uniref:Endoplasmic reticulum transmembrane protein n=1 Tax=Sphaerosporella brunnea TaxID=1250544 RepID=A0A5J5EKM8_9PEZI|nr:B-cell receptor-associated protein 31-like-domain-containing protein [Sphaerosporella brunnea]
MTLYYSLVFALLVLEMSVFLVLVFPLPFSWRKMMFEFISNSPLIAKLQYGMKITFIFILILFIDSVNRVYRVQRELSEHAQAGPYGQVGVDRMEVQARKFYSQRNMYLCGFTLFLSLILNRTYTFILDILRLETTLKELRAATAKGQQDGTTAEVIEKKDKEIAAMKSQAEGLAREYQTLADKYEALIKKDAAQTPKKDL